VEWVGWAVGGLGPVLVVAVDCLRRHRERECDCAAAADDMDLLPGLGFLLRPQVGLQR